MRSSFLNFYPFFCRAIYLVLLTSPTTSLANNNNEWAFSITPFFWATGQKGEVATFPPAEPTKIDISLSDILDNLSSTFTTFFEARKGQFGIYGEIHHIGVSTGADTPGSLYSGTDYEQDFWAISLAGMYRLIENDQNQLDAILGARYWHIDNTLDLDAGISPAIKTSSQEGWADIIFGLKGQTKLNKYWALSGTAIIAAAGDSDSYWDLFGGINYQYNDAMTFMAGYRHQEVDFEEGDFLFDTELSGPILGLKVNF